MNQKLLETGKGKIFPTPEERHMSLHTLHIDSCIHIPECIYFPFLYRSWERTSPWSLSSCCCVLQALVKFSLSSLRFSFFCTQSFSVAMSLLLVSSSWKKASTHQCTSSSEFSQHQRDAIHLCCLTQDVHQSPFCGQDNLLHLLCHPNVLLPWFCYYLLPAIGSDGL